MLIAGIVLLAAVATGVVIHLGAQVKDSYFDPDTDKLRQLPADLVVVRPTHFPNYSAKISTIEDSKGKSAERLLGRNVSLPDVIGAAWDCNPARVVLPADAPKGGFDFLVTTSVDSRQRMQESVRKELGYTAHQETRDTPVWILNVANPGAPGLTVSSENEKAGATVQDGRLYLKHLRLSVILGGLSQGLKQPVVDKTGLDAFYDFSVPWTAEVQQHLQNGAFSADGVKKVLAGLGLSLEPGNQPMEMYVVEKL